MINRWMSRVGVGAVVVAAVALTACGQGGGRSSNTPPERIRVEVTSPTSSLTITEQQFVVTGIISHPDSNLTINDAVIPMSEDGAFQLELPLAYGANRISVRAEMEGMTAGFRSFTVNRQLQLEIASPSEGLVTGERRLNVSGIVSDTDAHLLINGFEVTLAEDGAFTYPLDLHYPLTTVNVTAALEGVPEIKRQIDVRLTS